MSFSVRYRHEFKSNELWQEIKLVLDTFAQPLTELFKVNIQCLFFLGPRSSVKEEMLIFLLSLLGYDRPVSDSCYGCQCLEGPLLLSYTHIKAVLQS